ncbi:glycosyltransferase family 4 protein [Empedobacter brevis]|uniref:glycosyltransferase family 4 protein n=1 Tax=Empedobacter brevis TaxID=247 RepID=UPI0039B01CF4
MKSKIRVAFVSNSNPLDKTSWSGTQFQIFKSLQNQFEYVKAITCDNKWLKIFGIINKITIPLFNKKYNYQHSLFRSYFQSKAIQKSLNKENFDVIFCSAGSTEIAYLNTNIPIVYLSDSSFGQLADYYDVFKNLFNFSKKESNLVELKALNKASHIIYPTNWAKNYVIKNYDISPSKISKIHFGANINDNLINYNLKKLNQKKTFNILFLGVYWERKGGDIVLETFTKLKMLEKNVHLTICGSNPYVTDSDISIFPFIDKNNEKEIKKLIEILEETDLLFVPTRAECYGIVFNEAGAFGIPVLTTKTGGVPEIVIDNYNGYTLDLNEKSDSYLEIILNIMNNNELYSNLSHNARKKYTEENNWNFFGLQVRKIIENIS